MNKAHDSGWSIPKFFYPGLMHSHLPFFSIIIPTRDRPSKLAECLKSIQQLEYPADRFEVVVVDDGSVQMFTVAPDSGGAVVPNVFRQAPLGPAAARNNGARRAKGEYLFFTDDDCRPAPDTLKKLAAVFRDHPDKMIGGRTLNVLTGNIFSTASELLIAYLYEYFHSASRFPFVASNNLAVRADKFKELVGFDEGFPLAAGEDRDLCERWVSAGRKIMHVEDVFVAHAHDLSLATFLRQHFRYGRGASIYHQAFRERHGFTASEPLSFYINLIAYPFAKLKRGQALPAALLLVAAQLANALGVCFQRFFGGRGRL